MKTIKVIDLLIKMVNGEDVPKYIAVRNGNGLLYFRYDEEVCMYRSGDADEYYIDYMIISPVSLTDEVEIVTMEEYYNYE